MKLSKATTNPLDYFFIGWEESDSHDECVAKFGKWHVPGKRLSTEKHKYRYPPNKQEKNSAVLVNVQMCFIDGMICWD